jgi:hypothetical protein
MTTLLSCARVLSVVAVLTIDESYKVPVAVVSYILEFIAKFFEFIRGLGKFVEKR